MKKGNPKALLPIGVFLVLYLGLGIVFEYVLKIPMGFYKIPIVVAFLAAILVACLQNPKVKFDDKLVLMGQGVGDKNIITMILIFMVAGIFVGVVGRSSAESVAYFMLSLIPARFAVAVLFVVSCFVSTAMGTSVGTITLITPIGVAVSAASGFSLPLCIGAVMGGAMFGDNLSFISDTTIAACNGQGCAMKDKFRANFAIALPAIASALLFNVGASSGGTDVVALILKKYAHMQNTGEALFITDLAMVLAACFVFDLYTALYSFVGLTVKSLVVDAVLEQMKMCKAILIICDDKDPICDFVMRKLVRGATYTPCYGAYTDRPHYMIYTTLTHREALQLQAFIHKENLNAFISMLSTTEVFGKGFNHA